MKRFLPAQGQRSPQPSADPWVGCHLHAVMPAFPSLLNRRLLVDVRSAAHTRQPSRSAALHSTCLPSQVLLLRDGPGVCGGRRDPGPGNRQGNSHCGAASGWHCTPGRCAEGEPRTAVPACLPRPTRPPFMPHPLPSPLQPIQVSFPHLSWT